MTCTHTASTKGDYEDPYKPAARSSLELTIMPAVGASSAFSIVVVPLSERNVSALAGAFSPRQLAAHHGTLTRDLDSLLAEAQILLYLLLALQCIQELVLGLGNIRATYMRGQACETDGSRDAPTYVRPRLRACLRRVLRPNTTGALTVASTLYLECT
jgi:hypothetical protein